MQEITDRMGPSPASSDLVGHPEPEDSEWRLSPGERIVAELTTVKLLGGGSRYEAYLAWDERRRALVVAKMLRPGLVADEHALSGLRAEAEMLSCLQHPVIVRHFGAELEGSRPHIVLEHIEGPRLSTLLRRYGPLAPDQLLPLALQLLAAAHYMARRGVVHLDVKPSNIIMSGPPRLIDLSVARTVARAGRLTEAVGTDDYMAPEQCSPEPGAVGSAADVWGIGATLYEALTGEPPFPGGDPNADDPVDQWPQLGDVAPHPAPPHDQALATAIMSCLEQDPAARPAAGQLADRLEPLLEDLAGLRLARLKPRLGRRESA